MLSFEAGVCVLHFLVIVSEAVVEGFISWKAKAMVAMILWQEGKEVVVGLIICRIRQSSQWSCIAGPKLVPVIIIFNKSLLMD